MPSTEMTIDALYDWARRIEDELEEYKAAFPDALVVDRNRCIASFRCLRVSLEVRVQARFPKRPVGLPQADGAQDRFHRQSA